MGDRLPCRDDVATDRMTERFSDEAGSPRSLVFCAEEVVDGRDREPCLGCKTALVPAFCCSVLQDQTCQVSDGRRSRGSHVEPTIRPLAPSCQQVFSDISNNGSQRPYHAPEVAKRRVFSTELGRYFAELREARGWTQRQAEDLAIRRGLKALGRQTIWRLETGRIKSPSRETIRDFAELFELDYEDLVGVVVRHTYKVDRPPSGPRAVLGELSTNDGPREFVFVPLLDGRIAAGPPLVIRDLEILDYIAFPPILLDQLGVHTEFAKCVRVGQREMSMFPTIKPNDTVLLDCSDSKRDNPTPGQIYAVNVDDGSTLKRVMMAPDGITLHSDNLDKNHYPMRPIAFDDDTQMRNIVVGEAVWAGGAVL